MFSGEHVVDNVSTWQAIYTKINRNVLLAKCIVEIPKQLIFNYIVCRNILKSNKAVKQ